MSRVVTGGRVLPWVTCVLLSAASSPVSAQAHEHGMQGLRIGAQAMMLLTHASPALAGNDLTEGYLTQPMLLGHANWRGLAARLTVNLEGWTLDRGELNAGNAGEGYVDRRHPHTFLHEAMLSASAEHDGWVGSIAAGRGFAPFGTDDPMARPLAKYSANHHLAQILERWLVMGALRRGPVMVEAGLFNGDEPTAPESLGRLSRVGDSWSLRVTLLPIENVELQASHAQVESPEHTPGGGLDHRKWSASARATTERGYALLEWARTHEYSSNGRRAFAFGSLLGEASTAVRAFTVAARYERTTRPEEERLSDAFRSARPHADENIIGVTRWRIATLHVARAFDFGELHVAPFAEASRLSVEEITGSIFDPVEHYGSSNQWSLSAGFRIGAGARHERMGRYGVAVPGS
jgi:hypothetical protein